MLRWRGTAEINIVYQNPLIAWRQRVGFVYAGDEYSIAICILLLIPLLFWCVSPSLRVSLMIILGTALNSAIKIALAGPRPFWYSPQVRALTAETSFGIPSAHAQNAVGVWGVLAAARDRRWSWTVAVILAAPGRPPGSRPRGSGPRADSACVGAKRRARTP